MRHIANTPWHDMHKCPPDDGPRACLRPSSTPLAFKVPPRYRGLIPLHYAEAQGSNRPLRNKMASEAQKSNPRQETSCPVRFNVFFDNHLIEILVLHLTGVILGPHPVRREVSGTFFISNLGHHEALAPQSQFLLDDQVSILGAFSHLHITSASRTLIILCRAR